MLRLPKWLRKPKCDYASFAPVYIPNLPHKATCIKLVIHLDVVYAVCYNEVGNRRTLVTLAAPHIWDAMVLSDIEPEFVIALVPDIMGRGTALKWRIDF